MYKFIHILNTAYSVLEHHIVVKKLLLECYTDVENQVQNLLTDCQWLNFTMDESDNKVCRQIANFSVNISTHGFLFLRNYHTYTSNQSADFLFKLIALGIEETCNDDVTCCNSLAIDTCSAMRFLHTKMGEDPYFKHVFLFSVICMGFNYSSKRSSSFPPIYQFSKKLNLLPPHSLTLGCNWQYFERNRLLDTDRSMLSFYWSSLLGALNTTLSNP